MKNRSKKSEDKASKPQSLKASKPQSLKASKPQSLKASKPQSLKASKPQSLKASKPQSLKASKPQSLKASKPQSLKASKPLGVLLGVVLTLGSLFLLNSVLAVWSGSDLVQKVTGERIKLTDINTIIGLVQNIWNDGGNIGIGTAAPNALLEVAGNIITLEPTSDNHVATKNYVDSSITAAGSSCYYVKDDGSGCNDGYSMMPGTVRTSTGTLHKTCCPNLDISGTLAGGSCYYAMDGIEDCTSGYAMAPGVYQQGTYIHRICCPGTTTPDPTPHYFVLTHDTWNGNFGGIAGANAKCRADLTAYDWKGKENVDLGSANIKAWLCDLNSCNNFTPSVKYTFAASGLPEYGGGYFFSDSAGRGPGNANSWASDSHFGSLLIHETFFAWSHRYHESDTLAALTPGPEEIPLGLTACSNYTSSSGSERSYPGVFAYADRQRWAMINIFEFNCSQSKHLYCTVN